MAFFEFVYTLYICEVCNMSSAALFKTETKVIDTKFKEVYYSHMIEENSSKGDRDSQLMHMMNLMAFQNLELVNMMN